MAHEQGIGGKTWSVGREEKIRKVGKRTRVEWEGNKEQKKNRTQSFFFFFLNFFFIYLKKKKKKKKTERVFWSF